MGKGSANLFYSYVGKDKLSLHELSKGTFSSVALCDQIDCSTPDFPIHHQLPELAQTHVHGVGDAIQPSHPLSSPSPPALNLSQHLKGVLVYSQARGAGSSRQATEYDYNNKSNEKQVKATVSTWESELAFSLKHP